MICSKGERFGIAEAAAISMTRLGPAETCQVKAVADRKVEALRSLAAVHRSRIGWLLRETIASELFRIGPAAI